MLVVPLSIMFLGGNQSIADRLTGSVVRVDHDQVSLPEKIGPKVWAGLISANVTMALLFAILWHLAVTSPLHRGGPPPPGSSGTFRIYDDPESIAVLWEVLPIGLKDPALGIRTIELLDESPNPFSFEEGESFLRPPVDPQPYLKGLKEVRVVRVTLSRERPTLIRQIVAQNFAAFMGQRTGIGGRPVFSLLQFATEENFGLFSVDQYENELFCFMMVDGRPVNFYVDVQPRGESQFLVSIDEIGFMLVGAGIPHS